MKSRAAQTDVSTLRSELERWVREIAGMRRHGTTHQRPIELYEEREKSEMLPLPKAPWEPVLWSTPKLHRDCRALVERALCLTGMNDVVERAVV